MTPHTKPGVLLFVTVLTYLLTLNHASAEVIAYEGLDYSAGSGNLLNASGGTGWTGGWSSFATDPFFNTIDSGSLSYTDNGAASLITSGNSATISSANTTSPNFERDLSSTLTPTDGSSLWISFLGRGSGGSSMGFTLVDGSTDLILFGNSQTNNVWGIRQISGGSGFNSTGVTMTDSVGTLGDTFMVVAKISFKSGADTVELFINPESLGGAEPTSGTSLGYATQELVNIASVSSVRVQVSTVQQKFSFDEIRIGNSYADVTPVPESSSTALLFASLVGLWILSKRFRKTDKHTV